MNFVDFDVRLFRVRRRARRQCYGDTLGLDASMNDMGILEIKLPGGGRTIAYPKPDHQPATYTCLNLIVADIEATVDELTAAGVTMMKYDQPQMTTDAKGIVERVRPGHRLVQGSGRQHHFRHRAVARVLARPHRPQPLAVDADPEENRFVRHVPG